jgi:hypothetical protein
MVEIKFGHGNIYREIGIVENEDGSTSPCLWFIPKPLNPDDAVAIKWDTVDSNGYITNIPDDAVAIKWDTVDSLKSMIYDLNEMLHYQIAYNQWKINCDHLQHELDKVNKCA